MIEIGRRIVRSVLLYVSVGDSECLAKCPQGSNTNTDSVIKCKKILDFFIIYLFTKPRHISISLAPQSLLIFIDRRLWLQLEKQFQ